MKKFTDWTVDTAGKKTGKMAGTSTLSREDRLAAMRERVIYYLRGDEPRTVRQITAKLRRLLESEDREQVQKNVWDLKEVLEHITYRVIGDGNGEWRKLRNPVPPPRVTVPAGVAKRSTVPPPVPPPRETVTWKSTRPTRGQPPARYR